MSHNASLTQWPCSSQARPPRTWPASTHTLQEGKPHSYRPYAQDRSHNLGPLSPSLTGPDTLTACCPSAHQARAYPRMSFCKRSGARRDL